MKRISSSFIAILLGLAPAALASPNQGQQAQQPQTQSWNEQNAWNEQAPQGQWQQQQPEQQPQQQPQQQQEQQPQPQQQPEQEQEPEEQEEQGEPYQQGQQQGWQQGQQQGPQQAPPAWQQPMPNAGWQQQQSQNWNQQGPMESGPFQQGPSESDTYEWSETNGPHLGILVEGMTPELRSYFRVPNDRGVLVARIQRNSPAQRAGIQVGDVLMAVQGQPVNNANDVLDTLAQLSRGEVVHLDVMRDGRHITLTTQLSPRERPMYRSQGFQSQRS